MIISRLNLHGSVRSSWVPPNGNLIKDDHAEYSYDGFNRLSEVKTVEGKTQRNRYDAEGLRAELEENGELVRFLYHNGEVIAETGENQATIRYIRGIGLISSDSEEAKFYYHYVSDERGSITDIVKAAVRKKLEEDSQKTQNEESTEEGQETGVLNHYEYDAFGNTLECKEEVENRFRFTGEIYDAVTGQYYLRARFYNPVLGRFIQEDDRYTDGLNLYAYCKNNPVRYTDPSGHETESQPDRDNQEAPGGRTDRPDAPPNEKSNQAEIRKLVEELNAAGGATPDEAQAIRELAEEYNLDYDSLGLQIKDDAATVNSAGSQVGNGGTEPTNVPPGYYQDSTGKWHRPNGDFASNAEVGLPSNSDHYLHRPYIRQETIDAINARTEVDYQTGQIYDSISGKWVDPSNVELGHTTGNEFWYWRDMAESQGWTQAQFNDFMNEHPEFYAWQDITSNRSHLYEDPH